MQSEKQDQILTKTALLTIENILRTEYGIPRPFAHRLVRLSGVAEIFDRDIVIASHTSYKTWAKRVYMYAKSSGFLKELSYSMHVDGLTKRRIIVRQCKSIKSKKKNG